MNNVKITLEVPDANGVLRTVTNILPQTAIEATQRIYGTAIKSIMPVDESGNEIKATINTRQSREDIAMEAMKARAKALGIRGYQKMSSSTLLKAIQEHSNKSAVQTASNVLTETI